VPWLRSLDLSDISQSNAAECAQMLAEALPILAALHDRLLRKVDRGSVVTPSDLAVVSNHDQSP
jgi:hypothetical protein